MNLSSRRLIEASDENRERFFPAVGWAMKLMDVLFGCSHKRYTFPITTRPGQNRSEAAAVTGTYVVCLDCGREFPYDWREMKLVPLTTAMSTGLAEASEVINRAA